MTTNSTIVSIVPINMSTCRFLLGVIIYFSCATTNTTGSVAQNKPNIIIVIGDDMGWNDVGFHGSNQIPTPNIDALAYNGIILDRFYTQNACTPSRTALLTGNYAIRSGMQGTPLSAGENRSLPLDMPIMPEQLKKLGYKTHLVGKWHLGAAYRRNTPTSRGFDTHFGYWNGFVGYFDYVSFSGGPSNGTLQGFDLHDRFKSVWEAQGTYATELFTKQSLDIIDKHNTSEPLFLILAHLAAHTGKDGTELGVPNVTLTDLKYDYIQDSRRRRYADVVNLMDDSVGKIVKKLADRKMLDNSIVLFFSDNGAPSIGIFNNTGSNWPLRGMKGTEFEGGVRCAAAIFSPLFQKTGYVNREMIHVSDWLPTFYAAAGGNLTDLGTIDGINQWETLSQNLPTNRTELLLNVNEVANTSALIINNGQYKVLQGTYKSGLGDKYYGESGRDDKVPPYNITAILQSETNNAIQDTTGTQVAQEQILKMRIDSDLSWCRSESQTPDINCIDGCLFDLINDPCETVNIIGKNPERAKTLLVRLDYFFNELVPQTNKDVDPAADPVHYNNTWCTWLDDELCVKTPYQLETVIY